MSLASLDLTAAFDVVDRNLLRKRLKIMETPVQLIHLLDDWLSDRSAYCEVKKNNYEFFDVNFGTIQGSVNGPLLFALFISLLADLTTLTTYADDNYLFSSGETEKKALENCIKETKIAMKWFLNSEFCVNQKKTEVSVFYQNDSRACKAVFGSEKVNVLKNMKILGLIFDSKLNWYHQTVTAIEKANKAKQALRIISRYFSPQKMVKLPTALFYSRL